MIHFKTMWEDVCNILTNNKIENLETVECFKTGFIVKTNGVTEFITKDDFVDFWCNMLCFNNVSETEINKTGNEIKKCIYTIVKNLPYVNANNGVISLLE